MSGVERRAQAKLNLTLEVLGRRPDGYHEIRSIAVTCSLSDDLRVQDGSGLLITADEEYDSSAIPAGPSAENTVETALALMVQERARLRGGSPIEHAQALRQGVSEVAVRLHKRIPAAAGLGGGSSDGAAALQALDALWDLRLGPDRLRRLAADIGSDCAFFVAGGLQYMQGRGEILEPLPDLPAASLAFCIVRPPVSLPGKTARLYALLEPAQFSDGGASDRLARRLSTDGAAPEPHELLNVFDAVADAAYGDQTPIRRALSAAGARAVHLCGAGPAIYGLFASPAEAGAASSRLAAEGYVAWAVTAPGP